MTRRLWYGDVRFALSCPVFSLTGPSTPRPVQFFKRFVLRPHPWDFEGHAFNAPTVALHAGAIAHLREIGARSLLFSGQTSPVPAASTGRRSDHSGTLVGATGGIPKLTRA